MRREGLSYQEVAGFCRSFYLLLQAGIGFGDAMFLAAEEEEGRFGEILKDLGERLDQGESLSVVMAGSGIFPAYVTGMVQVGERTGRLEESFYALAVYYEERSKKSRMVRNALAFPTMILLLMLAVIAVLLIQVLPVFDQVYISLGSRLTGIAAGLLHVGEILKASLPVLFVLLLILAVSVLLLIYCSKFRDFLVSLWQRKLGDKGVFARFNNAQFARALAMGLLSGLTLEEAMDLAGMLLADIPGAAKRCERSRRMLKNGGSLAQALRDNHFLSAAACRMLTVGMRGGNGDKVMSEIAGPGKSQATAGGF